MKLHLPLSLALVVAGCRVLPHEELPELAASTPDGWSSAAPAGDVDPSATWWIGFQDPALEAAVDEALAANLDLRTSATRVAQAAAQARIAGAARLPSLSANGTGNRSKQIFVGLPVPGGDVLESTATSVGVSLDVSWELDLWGRLAAQEEAGAKRLAAAAEDYRAARHSIAAQTAKAWFAWQEARAQRALAAETTATFERTADLTRQRFESGIASAFEVRLASANLASARALQASRDDEVERAVRQLELLLGRYPGGLLEADEDLATLPPVPPAGVPGELVARRPDLAAAELRLFAADDDLYAARAALYPSLSLNGSVGRTSNETGDLVDPDFSVWSIAGGLTQPLFQGGRLRANVDLEDARVQEALQGFEAALLRAFTEVEIALTAEERLAALEDRTRELRDEASAARELADQRYESGLADLLDVLDSQRRELDAKSQLIAVEARRRAQRVDLHLALGGGFESTPTPNESESRR